MIIIFVFVTCSYFFFRCTLCVAFDKNNDNKYKIVIYIYFFFRRKMVSYKLEFFLVTINLWHLASLSNGYQIKFETSGHNVYEKISLDVPISFYGSFYKKIFVSISLQSIHIS